MFNPSRLTISRKRRGLTKTALADKAGLTPQSVSEYERGNTVPTRDTLAALSRALRFPEAFFFGDDLEEPSPTGASFRGLAAMTSGQRDRALATGALAIAADRWVSRRFRLPPIDLTTMHGFEPEAAAQTLRDEWGLGEKRCPNLVHLLESRGVRVYSLPRDSETVHAFSFWHGGTPFVFLTTDTSGEKGRFDAAHELGHLVLHSHGAAQGRQAEIEADQFASAFLMPRSSVLAVNLPAPTIEQLVPLKKRWNVSLAALVHRLRHVERLSEWQYRGLCIELAKRGFRKSEPGGIDRESSQVFQKIFASLKSDGVVRSDVARDLSIRTADLDAITFGLVVADDPDNGDHDNLIRRPEDGGERPKLRLVLNTQD
jgi:Zn-dependent peptidase ImmA (M78 family)/transcriptional regulator with XRE-family HTH domain